MVEKAEVGNAVAVVTLNPPQGTTERAPTTPSIVAALIVIEVVNVVVVGMVVLRVSVGGGGGGGGGGSGSRDDAVIARTSRTAATAELVELVVVVVGAFVAAVVVVVTMLAACAVPRCVVVCGAQHTVPWSLRTTAPLPARGLPSARARDLKYGHRCPAPPPPCLPHPSSCRGSLPCHCHTHTEFPSLITPPLSRLPPSPSHRSPLAGVAGCARQAVQNGTLAWRSLTTLRAVPAATQTAIN